MKHDHGEQDLQTLIKHMQPILEEEDLVFCSLPPDQAEDYLSLCQGFIVARITEVLAAQGISVNVVSGYYHDHLFIKESQSEEALKILKLWQKKLSE
jgi:hypothetical protein